MEGEYPTAIGSGGQDNVLRLSLVKFANSLFKEIERKRRWSLAYGTTSFVTSAGVQLYTFPTSLLVISRLYYLLPSGDPITLELYDAQELRRIYGEGPAAPQSMPRMFAINGTQIELFPPPDTNGGANYTIIGEGYGALTPIVEATGTTVALSTQLTVPATGYLTSRGVPAAGSAVSIRQAGYAGINSTPDTWITPWTAIPDATHVTLQNAAITAVVSGQVFFNSFNWLIDGFDMVVLFGVLREVAAYEKENFDIWDKRYQAALEEMAQFDFDRKSTLERMATAVTGQRQAQLRILDFPGTVEVRGAVLG
jgi:hypothetical protein